MPDRREPDWPISRLVVRMALVRMDITPLHKPTDIIMLAGSDAHQWVRFEVPFSRLSIERLPMEIDGRTRQYLDDEARLARQIVRAFTEPITDMSIVRRGKWHYIATFTLYTSTKAGKAAYKDRLEAIKRRATWEIWAGEHT